MIEKSNAVTGGAIGTAPATSSREADEVRLVAFYLPQFHPIPENDEWWGRGFTEWTNVSRAESLFPGHWQPHQPEELGFYDLRLRDTRRRQIRLAKEHGIDAFCYHYYWFSGTRLLHEPLDDMLADPASDMPFCLCWANENWTRRWNGGDQDILIAQKYAQDDAERFIGDIAPFLRDRRYLKVDGKSLLIVYRPQLIPDIRATVAVWRRHAVALGLGDIHLCAALTFDNLDYAQFGFDSGVEFPPHNRTVLGVREVHELINFYRSFDGKAMLYHDLANAYLSRDVRGAKIFRGVFPSWDNTARSRNRALIFVNGTPGNYEYWLSATMSRMCAEQVPADRLVFINAWNEWAEGCHLEPDQKYGRAFLEATLRAKRGLSMLKDFPDKGIPECVAGGVRAFLVDMGSLFNKHGAYLVAKFHKRLRSILSRNPCFKSFLKSSLSRLSRGDRS
ncbi:glycosyltransferase WbsX family protein [Pseudothauera rhizosphaerae]|uniref:Glycosyl hydrolase n=1 Tax=Pseudothauera rhizosphaerae TaxID=2565932 RepID=A0A4S4ADB7_9RHOO|nr:glycoside hydrolase family 99-like domain-containing protein [Pseudothauera rhizosphaerae]THF56183.1 glycosyl hydrolase [Pseudothauera rhizosphaerae]